MKRFLMLGLSLSLVACGPAPSTPGPSVAPTPTPGVGSSAAPQATASPSNPVSPTASPGSQATAQPSSQPTANPSVPQIPVPANLQSIQLAPASLVQLAGRGATLQLKIQGLDGARKLIDAPLPLSFSLTSPGVLSITEQGLVTALATSGSSVVIVRVPDTNFETRILLSIGPSTSGGGGGGGGGGSGRVNQAPLVSITPSETTVYGTGRLVRLTGVATDPEGQALSYLWTCLDTDCGDFLSATAAESFWRSPVQSGTYRLQLTVTDTGNAKTSLVQEIEVVTGTGQSQVQVGQRIWYVREGGSGNGFSWSTAFGDLQAALAVARGRDEIWVSEGTYKPTTNTDRDATFLLNSHVAIYGGFDATNPVSNPAQRNLAEDVTILSGDIGTVDDYSDNSYHVVRGQDLAILDGVTITGGNANGTIVSQQSGGGMYNAAASPILRHIVFKANQAQDGGGAMYNHVSTPSLTDVVFESNSAVNFGGAMYNLSSQPSLNKAVFKGNSSGLLGGGMFNMLSHPTLTEVVFEGNSGSGGGGLYNGSSNPTLTKVVFKANAVSSNGGGMSCSSNSNPILTHVVFERNTAGAYGGGMYNISSNPQLIHATFNQNTATIFGGGIFQDTGAAPTLVNVLFWQSGLSGVGLFGTVTTDADNNQIDSQGNVIAAVDPFVNSANPDDGNWFTPGSDGLRLKSGSLLLDKGVSSFADVTIPGFDILGAVRPAGSAPDPGTYEGGF